MKKVNKKISKSAFTILEMLITIGLLIILATISFFSLQSYNKYARDTTRLTDIKNIRSTMEYSFTQISRYPIPDSGTGVTFSGAIVWNQGTFGKDAKRATDKLSKVPVDPLSQNEYTYSILDNGSKFELGAALEGGEVARNITTQTYASENRKSYIVGNYNGQIVKVSTGGIDYVLALPSIIASDISNTQIESILSNKKLSIKGSSNLPHSYGNFNAVGNNLVNSGSFLAYTGTLTDLKNSETLQKEFILNLKKSYSGSVSQNEEIIAKLYDYSISDVYKAQELIKFILDPKFEITAQKTPEPIASSCLEMTEYHTHKLNTFFAGTIYNGNVAYWCGLTAISAFSKGLTGSIPKEIGNLKNLTYLHLGGNQISGNIPSEIGNLLNLTYLNISTNQLSGNIPTSIGNLTNLTSVYLFFNQLSGSIPSEIGNLTKLTALQLYGNQLSGSITASIGNLNSLVELRLNGNRFTGEIPTSIGNLTNLTLLLLNNNQLSGSIPTSIGNLINLLNLQLTGNQLTGNIPVEIGNLTNLTILQLSYNPLSGSIPTSIGSLTNLTHLYLNNINQLSGNIPTEIGNLTNLTHLYLNQNQLSGNIPTSIGNLNKLLYLNLQNNQLTGNIPVEIGNLNKLLELNLYVNQLSGSIPTSIGNLVNLTYLHLGYNQLSGSISSTIGNLNKLNTLVLAINQLTGPVPVELGNISTLKYLYLSGNSGLGTHAVQFNFNSSQVTLGNITIGGNGTNVVITQN